MNRSLMSRPTSCKSLLAHIAAVVWLLVVGLAYLAPALAHGGQLGDYELLRAFGLGHTPGTPLHNVVSSDQIQEMIPWTDLNWVEVHAGHLPFWNPYTGLGLPLAFNLQSASFSLPTLISYLFPLSWAYTVTIVVKMLIAGTGALFFGRVMGLRVGPATFGATVFELSGSFTAWLGWPESGVFCWLGWVLGAALLNVRGRHGVRDVGLLAAFLALSAFGGQPESLAMTLGFAILFVAVLVVAGRRDLASGSAKLRCAGRLVVGAGAGLVLASPLLLPSLQVLRRSSHAGSVVNLAFASYYGLPILHHVYFGPVNYYETAAYVGIGALVFAVLAVVTRWRHAEVLALVAVAVGAVAVTFSQVAGTVLRSLPIANLIFWNRALIPLDFVLAVLAGVGLQALLSERSDPRIRWAFAGLAGLAALIVAALGLLTAATPLSGGGAVNDERANSLVFPVIQAGLGLVAATIVVVRPTATYARERSRTAMIIGAAGLVSVTEVLFLLSATPDLWSSWPNGFAPTSGDTSYEHLVGSARVGFGRCPSLQAQPNLGILVEANSAFGVAEFASYDPVVPTTYFEAWGRATGQPGVTGAGNFCPSITSAALARQFGVSYVLTPPAATVPFGMHQVATLDGEDLLHVPGSGLITVGPPSAAPGAPETVLANRSSDPNAITANVDLSHPSTVRFRVTNMPGWQASVDGHPLQLHTWDDTMLSANLGPGKHHLTLIYRPKAFDVGLLLSSICAMMLVMGVLVSRRSRHTKGGGEELCQVGQSTLVYVDTDEVPLVVLGGSADTSFTQSHRM